MTFAARRALLASGLVLLVGTPLVEFAAAVGPLSNYLRGDYPPGQSAYVMMRPAALIAIVLVWFQWIVGTLGRRLERWLGVQTLVPLHKALGLSAVALVLLHPILFAWSRSLRSGKLEVVGTFVPPRGDNVWEFNLFFGAIGLYLVIVAVLAATLGRRLLPRGWRYVHALNYAAIASVFFHALSVGSDTRLPMTHALYWFLIATGSAATVFRVATLVRSKRGRAASESGDRSAAALASANASPARPA